MVENETFQSAIDAPDMKSGADAATVRRVGIVLGAAMLIVCTTAIAQEPMPSGATRPNGARGEALARHSCSGCHVVGGATSGTDAAPTFRSIARDPNKDPDHLRGFLVQPHPPMVPLQLSRMEIEDLIAYFQQLREQQ